MRESENISTAVATRLPRAFFEQPGQQLARSLIGTVLVRRVAGITRRARIVETEAYLGPRDLASHSSKGRTKRTEVMFGPAGHAYVYFIYGMHWMFNVVAGRTGEAHAVLIRGAAPLDGWRVDLSGPALLARAFSITGADNGLDLTDGGLFFVDDGLHAPKIARRKRIGIDYAGPWKHRLLRFVDTSIIRAR